MQQSTKRLWRVILSGGLTCVLIGASVIKYQQLGTWDKFMQTYTTIAPDVSSYTRSMRADDALQQVFFRDALRQIDDYTTGDAILSTLAQNLSHRISILHTLGITDPRVVATLSPYDQGTALLLDAYEHLATGASLSGLYTAYTLVEQANILYASISTGEQARSATTDNRLVAKHLQQFIHRQLVVAYGEYLLDLLTDIHIELREAHNMLSSLRDALRDWQPRDEVLQICKQDRQTQLTSHESSIRQSIQLLQQSRSRIHQRAKQCLQDGLCLPSIIAGTEQRGKTLEGIHKKAVQLRTDLAQQFTTLTDGDTELVEELCTTATEYALDDTIEDLLQSLMTKDFAPDTSSALPTTSTSGSQLSDTDAQYFLEDILDQQAKRLETTTSLQHLPSYDPKSLLQQLFDDFAGDTEAYFPTKTK